MSPILSVLVNFSSRAYDMHEGKRIPLFERTFPFLVNTLNQTKVDAEIIILDSTPAGDPRGLGDWCVDRRLRIVKNDVEFNRGAGRAKLGELASGEILYWMDADMIVPPQVITRGIVFARQGQAYYPLYDFEHMPGDLTRYSEGNGTGNLIIQREIYDISPKWPTDMNGWGGEDTKLAHWFKIHGMVFREHIPGFIHLWHPKGDKP